MPFSDADRPETVSAFLSHKYGAPEVNLFFVELIATVAPIAFRVDLGKFRTSTTRLERMIRDADAFSASGRCRGSSLVILSDAGGRRESARVACPCRGP